MKKEVLKKRGIFAIIVLASVLTVTFLITIGSAEVTELNVNPKVVIQGENVSLSGRAVPNETVWITSSFAISLPVSDGKYSAEFIDILFPPGEKKFSVTAENVEDIRISLGPLFFFPEVEYPLDGPESATNGTATIAISVPFTMGSITVSLSGEKDVKVYGNAAEDAEFVNLSIDMSIKVIADTNGDLKLDVNTGGIPLGEFVITAGAINKTVEVVSTKQLFDTCSPEYPYPSMCGIHNGTITPNQTITVSQLYTYPCPGTCGHTEQVTIWNDRGVIVEANWTGYRGDWRNISFDAVTLDAGETYNYSICTGSYPQIIHERTANVTGGTITCAQFTDANGKVYIDWIPAIILK
ncbi:MAG: hypothetical protein WBB08_05070 [Halobacteriota archaeon]